MATTKKNVWTDEERAAMQASAHERKSSTRRDPAAERAEEAKAHAESVAKMSDSDRRIAERLDAIVAAAVPDLAPKTYYGMPAWAKDGVTICWFKNAGKFKTRYGSLEFGDKAQLDEGKIWPVSYALPELDAGVERQVAALIKKAAG
jgi:uncharacterized protein YdhG (YjbR/CyaY superfamily)